ncbi:High mobility group B protein 3 [Bienertia sinuspersici]
MKGGKSKAETRRGDAKLSVKKGAAAKKGKPAKDPNKPKRPPSAFFVFMYAPVLVIFLHLPHKYLLPTLKLTCFCKYTREEFRVTYKQKHPNNKSVAAVGKAGGEKWKSLTDAEKAPYIQKAEKRKADYEKSMTNYNKKLAEGKQEEEEEESDKSRSEVNDEDDEDGSGEEDEDDD